MIIKLQNTNENLQHLEKSRGEGQKLHFVVCLLFFFFLRFLLFSPAQLAMAVAGGKLQQRGGWAGAWQGAEPTSTRSNAGGGTAKPELPLCRPRGMLWGRAAAPAWLGTAALGLLGGCSCAHRPLRLPIALVTARALLAVRGALAEEQRLRSAAVFFQSNSISLERRGSIDLGVWKRGAAFRGGDAREHYVWGARSEEMQISLLL